MLRVAAGLFLILHGVINAAIWIPPQRVGKLPGFGFQASWLFASVRPAVVTLALVAAGGFVFSGAAYLAQSPWWASVGTLAATASLALITATFTPCGVEPSSSTQSSSTPRGIPRSANSPPGRRRGICTSLGDQP
jgi:hypothetical protein